MAAVLATDVVITLVPLDATNDVPVPADIATTLGADHRAAGADIAFEMYTRNDWLATSGDSYWDPLATITLNHPEVGSWEDVPVEARTSGTEAGRLVRADGGRLIRAAMSADAGAFMTLFLAALRTGAPRR
jgi:purine nucleosidase